MLSKGGETVAKQARGKIVTGLDIGTTKICAIIADCKPDGVSIIGIGVHPSKGLHKGVVVNIESTVQSIKRALIEAEQMAGVKVHSVFTGVAGGHIKGFNSRGVVAVAGKDREVRQEDVERVMDAARAVAIPLDREVLHILPQEFFIDDQDGIKEPLGMYGVRLEAEVHIVTGAVTSVQNIIKSVNKADLDVEDIVLEQLASSEAALSPDEMELGTLLIDIGGGTTDIAIFVSGSICHTAVITLGGDHFTKDISVGLRTPMAEAERIKQNYGCALTDLIRNDERIEVPSVGGRKARRLSRKVLSEIIEPRAQEVFELVNQEITRSGYKRLLGAGVVLTGGAVIMEGIPEIAEQILDLPVRRGMPTGVGGLVDVVSSPIYSTGVGLVLYGANCAEHRKGFKRSSDKNIFNRILLRMKEWF